MKSYATFVMTLYEGIFTDAAIQLVDIKSSMDKDLSYLRRALEQRGLGFFTITLPDYGQWIDRSLDHGSFADHVEIPRGIPMYQGRPKLFWGILMKVFDIDGLLRPDADHWSVLLLRTLTQCIKKLEVPVRPLALKKTVKEFFDVEEHLPKSYPDTWDSDIPIWKPRVGHPLLGVGGACSSESPDLFGFSDHPGNRIPWHTLRVLSRRVVSAFGVPEWWLIRSKHGPGAVSERGWDSKFEFPIWPKKLGLWFPFDWFGSGNLDVPEFTPSDEEPPSRLIAVPKTQKSPRLICAEPIAHQWCQQGIWWWLGKRIDATLLRHTISFRSQAKSQDLALAGSLDGSVATLDLSAASDRLSTRLVEYIFQGSDILNGIHASRTRVVGQSVHPEFPKLHLLRKFATMGSALTFPIQSIVFAILSVWALRLAESRENDWNAKRMERDFARVRVFGDDIIVPKHAYELTKLVLHECGLLVNSQKSFGGSSFRESCGMDAFRGIDVTPPRVHKVPYGESASSMAALIEFSNNLYKKGFWYGSDKVLSLLPRKVRTGLFVGKGEEGGYGLYSFSGSDRCSRREHWDRFLQRGYTIRLAFTSRARVVKGRRDSSLIQFYHDEPARRRSILLGGPHLLPGLQEIDRTRAGSSDTSIEVTTIQGLPLGSSRLVRLDGFEDWTSGSVATSPLRLSKLRVYN